jgi:hypothetical protein
LVPQWKEYVIVNGEYLEVWCVPSATRVPCHVHVQFRIPYFLKALCIPLRHAPFMTDFIITFTSTRFITSFSCQWLYYLFSLYSGLILKHLTHWKLCR